MFIVLFLVVPALCEWVEISQHHVRKPTRTHNFRPIEKVTEVHLEDTTRATTIYLNQTLTERSWSKGNINKVPKLGNVQRVQLDDSPIKAPSLNVNPVRNTFNVGVSKSVIKNVKESVITNSDFIDLERHKIPSGVVENERHKINRLEMTENIEEAHPSMQVGYNTKHIFRATSSKIDRTKTFNNKNDSLEDLERVTATKKPNINNVNNSFKMPATKQEFNVTIRPHIFGDVFIKNNRVFMTDVETNNIRKVSSGNTDDKITSSHKALNQGSKPMSHETPQIVAMGHQDSIIRNTQTKNEYITKIEKPTEDTDTTVNDDDEDLANSTGAEDFQKENIEASNSNKVNSIENLMNFMKVVADTIKKNTRRSVNSKTRYLTDLKNTILANIAERIEATWPDDETVRPRRTRSAQASARGHLEIPSSESALMTISFLTFAVFLIKLVLQVIQTYKNKTMMVAPAVVAVGRAISSRP